MAAITFHDALERAVDRAVAAAGRPAVLIILALGEERPLIVGNRMDEEVCEKLVVWIRSQPSLLALFEHANELSGATDILDEPQPFYKAIRTPGVRRAEAAFNRGAWVILLGLEEPTPHLVLNAPPDEERRSVTDWVRDPGRPALRELFDRAATLAWGPRWREQFSGGENTGR